MHVARMHACVRDGVRRSIVVADVAREMRCRHCEQISFVQESYASTLVGDGGGFLSTAQSIEERIIPCVTAVCPDCDRVSLLSNGTMESCVRTVAMWRRVAEWIDQ